MYTVLGKNTSNRVVYDDGVSFAPASARACDYYQASVDSLDKLRVQFDDKYLSEADLSIVALRGCARCTSKLNKSPCTFKSIIDSIS